MHEAHQLRSETTHDPAWDRVRTWPGLTAELKLAWCYLWFDCANRGRERFVVTGAMVAFDQNVDSSAGRARLKQLLAMGFLRRIGYDRATGKWTAEMIDPAVVARELHVEWHPQYTFAFVDEPEVVRCDFGSEPIDDGTSKAGGTRAAGDAPPSARSPLPLAPAERPAGASRQDGSEEAHEDPPVEAHEDPPRPHLDLDKKPIAHLTSTLTSDSAREDSASAQKVEVEVSPPPLGGTSEGTSEAVDLAAEVEARRRALGYDQRRSTVPPPPTVEPKPAAPVADSVSACLARLTDPVLLAKTAEVEAEQIDRIVAWIVQRVNCPRLRGSRAYELAQGLVRGRIKREKVVRLLSNLDQQRPTLNHPSAYFNNGAKYILIAAGLLDGDGA